MAVLSPAEWGASQDYDSWGDTHTPDDGVALHHGGGSDYPAAQTPYTPEKEMVLLRSWERYHLSKGWRGLAYGWGVGQSGTIYRIRGWNRYGAHLGDIDGDGIANNTEIVPVIWIASGNHHQVSDEADQAIAWLRRNVIEQKSPNAKKLWGHKEVQTNKSTACPGVGGMAYVNAHRYLTDEGDSGMPLDQIGKAVVDIAFDLLGAQGDKQYWYDKEPDDGEFADLRNAITTGAAQLKAHNHNDAYVPKGKSVVIRGA